MSRCFLPPIPAHAVCIQAHCLRFSQALPISIHDGWAAGRTGCGASGLALRAGSDVGPFCPSPLPMPLRGLTCPTPLPFPLFLACRPPHRLCRPRRHNPDEDGQARGSSVFLHLMTAVFVCVFLGEIAANSWEFSPIQLNPLLGPGKDTLRKLGAKDTSLITDQDEWWRIFSSIFLSAGVIQLSGSLSAMWTFGRHLERELTSVTVAAVFLISAVGGALVSANLAPDAVTVSSTGGMFGLLGATSVEHMIDWRHYRHHAVTILNLVVVAAINLFIGLLPFVDNWCHVGGFVVGSLLCASILLNRRHGRNKFWEGCILVAQVGCALMALLVFTVFTIGLVMDLRIGADCRWCHFLTCVPSAWWTCDDVVTDPYPCSTKELSNSTVRLECPDGEKHWVRVLSSSKDNFRRLCQQQCSLSDMRDTGVIE
uniref:RHOMBOID-like protein n=1 Tax=Tetraselmis sp. GSL018 TaxID=582737 RepID=A0A061QW87_9CHLO